MVVSNNTLFDVRFEMNCDIHAFRSVDRGELTPLRALLTEHRCAAEKQQPRSSHSRMMLLRSTLVHARKHAQQGNPAAINTSNNTNIAVTGFEEKHTSKAEWYMHALSVFKKKKKETS